MGLGPAPRRALHAAINITPLVDIVLVMLVVFIIAVPAVNREIPVEVPPPSEGTPPPQLMRPGTSSTVFVDIAEPVAWRDAIGVMDTVRGVGAGTDRALTIALPLEGRVR